MNLESLSGRIESIRNDIAGGIRQGYHKFVREELEKFEEIQVEIVYGVFLFWKS